MNKLKIWYNPNCSKSREAMLLVEKNGCENEVIKYLENTPDIAEIKSALKMLNLSARELMRTKEDIYKELNLKDEMDEDNLIQAMFQNPILIERPVLFKNNKAIIGRPTSIIEDFLNS